MTDQRDTDQRDWPADRLRDAFEAHEHLAPEATPVHARIEELARGYRRRRRGLQAVGGVVAGAGLVAGAVAVPGFLHGGGKPEVRVQAVAAAPAASTPTPTATSDDQYSIYSYFAAGYNYDDAVKLAKIWGVSTSEDSIGQIKSEAAKKLDAGETLPVKPSGDPIPPAEQKKDRALGAFFDAGYDFDDATQLAKLWNLKDAYDAKVAGGQELLDGHTLPLAR
jgi:hypothetical protein